MTAPRTATCPTCSAVVADNDRFCKQCGTEVSGISASMFGAPRFNPATPAPATSTPASPWDQVLARLREVTAGEFMIGRELGRGGMAAVFLGQDLALNRKVAIKVMSPGLMVGDDMVQRFRREAITIANLHHANIVTVHAVRQLQDLHFFVMQFVEGQSLDGVLRAHGLLPVSLVLPMLHQVGSALAYAHRRGVVHRDIKPGNILLSGDGDALVTDFGIAKVAEGPTQTQTGMVVGTPTYMSPEQCYASELDGASDQYSLGIVAYQMLCGRAPFTGGQFEIMKGHTIDPVPSLREFAPDVPAEVEQAILRMLAKKPTDRFETFSDALDAMGATPLGERSPLRAEMIRLAGVEERREALGDLLRTPSSPISGARSGQRAPALAPALAPTPRTPSPAATAVAVAVAPVPASVEVGERVELRATVRGVADPSALRWSTDSPAIVQVDERSGALLAVAAGAATVIATVGEVVERFTVTVVAPAVASLRVDGPATDIHVGDTVRFTAQALDRRGAALAREIAWRVASGSISIAADGTLHAQASGRGEVVAACDGVMASVVLQVRPARVATVQFVTTPTALEVGQSITMRTVIADARGTPLLDRAVQWQLVATTCARIDTAGVFTAMAEGTAIVRAQCDDVVAEHTVRISPARVARVELSGAPALLRDGDRFTLTATARDERGATLTRVAIWQSSDASVATVSTAGAVHALAAGSTTITVSIDGMEASSSLVVHATPPMFAAPTAIGGETIAPASATAVLAGLPAPHAAPNIAAPAASVPSAAARRSPDASSSLDQAVTAAAPKTRSRSPLLLALALVPVAAIGWFLTHRTSNERAATPPTREAAVAAPPAAATSPSTEPELRPVPPDIAAPTPSPNAAEPTSATGASTALRFAPVPAKPLLVSESLQLRPVAPSGASIRYATSDRRVVRVDARSGLVTAVGPGRATIVADGGTFGRASIALLVQATDVALSGTTSAPTVVAPAPPPAATPQSAAPGTPAPPANTASAPTTTPAAASTASVSQAQLASEARATVESFAKAIESRDLGRVRAVYGGISSSYAADLASLFEASRSVRVTVRTITVTNGSGTYDATSGTKTSLSAGVTFVVTPMRGAASPPSNDTWPIVLQRESGGWRLVQVSSP